METRESRLLLLAYVGKQLGPFGVNQTGANPRPTLTFEFYANHIGIQLLTREELLCRNLVAGWEKGGSAKV